MTRRTKIIGFLALLTSVAIFARFAWWIAWWFFWPSLMFATSSAHNALQNFYDYPTGKIAPGTPEDLLRDPLILAGGRVAPLVTAEIQKKDMPLRGYAIGFLGNQGYRPALSVLERILADEAEDEDAREDALRSIYRIDASRGTELAAAYKDRDDYLGQIAREIMSGARYHRRTWLDAFCEAPDPYGLLPVTDEDESKSDKW